MNNKTLNLDLAVLQKEAILTDMLQERQQQLLAAATTIAQLEKRIASLERAQTDESLPSSN